MFRNAHVTIAGVELAHQFRKEKRKIRPGLMGKVCRSIPGQCCSWQKDQHTGTKHLGSVSYLHYFLIGITLVQSASQGQPSVFPAG